MEGLSTSWGYCSGSVLTTMEMIEQAKEELQILEAQHPNRFNYLKLELKSFISHFESQILLLSSDNDNNMNIVSCANPTSVSISSSVTTQESSVGKKRKKSDLESMQVMEGKNIEASKQKFQRVVGDGCSKRRDRIDVVFERAQACLEKIQQFKTNFS
ncbi:hypothetical protein ACH5RR_012022 [Cinchona calisaya]|uniref:Uncharacterized protein n=1 Tax=Cinchona calisaya TaxID=153742 RepID=A0ABD3A926_9GENT